MYMSEIKIIQSNCRKSICPLINLKFQINFIHPLARCLNVSVPFSWFYNSFEEMFTLISTQCVTFIY